MWATPAHAATGEAVNPWVALAYLVAGVFFILALRGLSSPSTSRTGNRFGMAGMLIAVATTLVTHDIANIVEIAIAIAIGGLIGFLIARRIAMTAMPELVAAFHSLVGLAAVLVGWAAYLNPGAFGLLVDGSIGAVSKVEMGLGIAIGAITFSGSVIAFAKLSGRMSGSPILLPARHVINLGTLAAIIVPTALFAVASGPAETGPLAIANSAVCFSNAVSSSPRSRPSVPSRSITSVGRCFRFASVAPVESGFEARASHTPRVVCDRPRSWSISRNVVPNTWFMSVDFPELCGPITATTR